MTKIFSLICSDKDTLFGKPRFVGTRISVNQVLEQLGEGESVKEILNDYPSLTKEHIHQAFSFSAACMNFEELDYSYA